MGVCVCVQHQHVLWRLAVLLLVPRSVIRHAVCTTPPYRHQSDLGRINSLIAQHSNLKSMLEEEHLQLEVRGCVCGVRFRPWRVHGTHAPPQRARHVPCMT
jgi:hypothetical protein